MADSLTLHEETDYFSELVGLTAGRFGIPEFYVRKDYWVTVALQRLAVSDYASEVVFKGGTALSKAHRAIHRFSEDIDLAVRCPGMGSSKLKRLLKGVEKDMMAGLEAIPDDKRTSKYGTFRKVVYAIPSAGDPGDTGQVSTAILLEINAFAVPEPSMAMPVTSLIHDFLIEAKSDDIARYGLAPFDLEVLGIERTASEKVLALVKASRTEDSVLELKRRIRHVYDLCMILRQETYKDLPEAESFQVSLAIVKASDLGLFPDASQWLGSPLAEASLFAKPEETWSQVSAEFKGPFRDMVFDDQLPTDEEVVTVLNRIKNALEQVA